MAFLPPRRINNLCVLRGLTPRIPLSASPLSSGPSLRQTRMTELCGGCVASFEGQSSALEAHYDEVSKRLDGLTQQVARLTAQLAALHPSLSKN